MKFASIFLCFALMSSAEAQQSFMGEFFTAHSAAKKESIMHPHKGMFAEMKKKSLAKNKK